MKRRQYSDQRKNENARRAPLGNPRDLWVRKKKKGGDIELKFFDRLKALEKLQSISSESESEDNSFYSAIEKGASALREYPIE